MLSSTVRVNAKSSSNGRAGGGGDDGSNIGLLRRTVRRHSHSGPPPLTRWQALLNIAIMTALFTPFILVAIRPRMAAVNQIALCARDRLAAFDDGIVEHEVYTMPNTRTLRSQA